MHHYTYLGNRIRKTQRIVPSHPTLRYMSIHSTSSTFAPNEPVNDRCNIYTKQLTWKASLTRHTYRQHGGGGTRTNRVKVKYAVPVGMQSHCDLFPRLWLSRENVARRSEYQLQITYSPSSARSHSATWSRPDRKVAATASVRLWPSCEEVARRSEY